MLPQSSGAASKSDIYDEKPYQYTESSGFSNFCIKTLLPLLQIDILLFIDFYLVHFNCRGCHPKEADVQKQIVHRVSLLLYYIIIK